MSRKLSTEQRAALKETKLTKADEKRIAGLVKQAVS
jgi:hypothetical protein